jgi:hypothetical protein
MIKYLNSIRLKTFNLNAINFFSFKERKRSPFKYLKQKAIALSNPVVPIRDRIFSFNEEMVF